MLNVKTQLKFKVENSERNFIYFHISERISDQSTSKGTYWFILKIILHNKKIQSIVPIFQDTCLLLNSNSIFLSIIFKQF